MNFETLINQATGRWHSIFNQVGVDAKYLVNKHGPCPLCGGRDRFRFDNKKQQGEWICSNCGAGDGFGLISKVKNIPIREAFKLVEPLISNAPIKETFNRPAIDGRSGAEKLWKSTRSVKEGSPVWSYLTSRLNGFYPSKVIREGHVTHSSDKGRPYFIMAAKVSDSDGRGVSVHKTYVMPDGQPAAVEPRKMLTAGAIPPGSAVRLTEPARHMGIAEGIETAMSAHILFGVPTWSGINATMLKSFQPPKICEFLTIFADNDLNFTGHSAAYDLARRLKMTNPNLKIEVQVPSRIGDWNDVLKGQRDEFRFED
jgi:putative DNA primase/helicase